MLNGEFGQYGQSFVMPRMFNKFGIGRDKLSALPHGKSQKAAVIDGHPVAEGQIDGKRKKRALRRVEINAHVLDGSYGEIDFRSIESRVEAQGVGQFIEQKLRRRKFALVR